MSDKELKALKAAVTKAEKALALKQKARDNAQDKYRTAEAALDVAHGLLITSQANLIQALTPEAK